MEVPRSLYLTLVLFPTEHTGRTSYSTTCVITRIGRSVLRPSVRKWVSKIFSLLKNHSIYHSGIQSYDIVSTLQFLGMIKYWRGKHVILKKEDIIEDYLERTRRRPKDKEVSAEYLKWKPYEPSAKEKRQAEQIKRKQEERQKGR